MAVTKGIPLDTVRDAAAAGITRFGENRVQEAERKIAAFPDAEWHLVGRLQSNKARRAAAKFAEIHSVDGIALLERLDRLAGESGTRPAVYLEVNVSGEPTKAGFAESSLTDAGTVGKVAAAVRAAAHVRTVGLMTIAPLVAHADEARPHFRRLRELRDALQEAAGIQLPELSMGMSADLEAAVAEGATVVRIGTAIFGLRRR